MNKVESQAAEENDDNVEKPLTGGTKLVHPKPPVPMFVFRIMLVGG